MFDLLPLQLKCTSLEHALSKEIQSNARQVKASSELPCVLLTLSQGDCAELCFACIEMLENSTHQHEP